MKRNYLLRSADYASGNANAGSLALSFPIKAGLYKVSSFITTNNLPALFSFNIKIEQASNKLRSSNTTGDSRGSIYIMNNVANGEKLLQLFDELPQFLKFTHSTRRIDYSIHDSAGAAIDLSSNWELVIEKVKEFSDEEENIEASIEV